MPCACSEVIDQGTFVAIQHFLQRYFHWLYKSCKIYCRNNLLLLPTWSKCNELKQRSRFIACVQLTLFCLDFFSIYTFYHSIQCQNPFVTTFCFFSVVTQTTKRWNLREPQNHFSLAPINKLVALLEEILLLGLFHLKLPQQTKFNKMPDKVALMQLICHYAPYHDTYSSCLITSSVCQKGSNRIKTGKYTTQIKENCKAFIGYSNFFVNVSILKIAIGQR